MIVFCRNCDKDFDKRPTEIKRSPNGNHFCSKRCSAIWTNRNYPKSKKAKSRSCKICKNIYVCSKKHRSRILCPKCSNVRNATRASKATTLGEVRNSLAVKGKHPSWAHARVRANNQSWNKDLAKLPCQVCGYSLHVELCHIKPISSFLDDVTLGEVNHPDNILVLCRNHHWEFDNGHIKLENIPYRN